MVRCPHCGSSGVKRARALYAQSTSLTRRRSTGLWLSRRGPGVWYGRSVSRRTSLAAAQNAETQVVGYIIGFVGTAGMVIGIYAGIAVWPDLSFDNFISTMLLAMILTVLGVVLGWKWTRSMREQEAVASETRWYCLKCGSTFYFDIHGNDKRGIPSTAAPLSSSSFGDQCRRA